MERMVGRTAYGSTSSLKPEAPQLHIAYRNVAFECAFSRKGKLSRPRRRF